MTKSTSLEKPIIIAGPCAAESEEQIARAIAEATKRSVDFVRVNLWKPRTKYDFDGMIVEVHHDPVHALTDQKQQITWEQFDELAIIKQRIGTHNAIS